MKNTTTSLCLLLTSSFLLASIAVNAQISSDGTLPTRVNPTGNQFEITGGSNPDGGSNLFHSFSEFSVPTNNTAIFQNASNIANIIGRVTGGSVSNIDGLIQANNANLILINPNGINFGPNAQLDIGGSFLGTTASSVQFADGREFTATAGPPMLTVSVPVGVQFWSKRGRHPGTGGESRRGRWSNSRPAGRRSKRCWQPFNRFGGTHRIRQRSEWFG